MVEINLECINAIEPNPKGTEEERLAYLEAVRILLQLLGNVLSDTNNPKFRTIKFENKLIKERLLSHPGIEELLKAIGFERDNIGFTLPEVQLPLLQDYYDVLKKRQQVWVDSKTTDDLNHSVASLPYRQRITFPAVLRTSNPFLQSMESHSDSVMQYEDEILQALGRSLIPLSELTEQAKEKLLLAKDEAIQPEPSLRDLLLVELTNWFNTEFFTWVDNLPCNVCGKEDPQLKTVAIDADNLRVEIGWCCGQQTKFHRHNDVEKLLITRQGRCGEYANCFTFLCRCLDYDARLVCSEFDHVWTEVYSESQGRWLHVDPSENVIDAPLIYQCGWKRDVDYIIAYSRNDVQDVTWRYVHNHQKVLQNRKNCNEKELVGVLTALRQKRQHHLSAEDRKKLSERSLIEVIQLTLDRAPTADELKGRSSGSLVWRLSRGEHLINDNFVFKLTDEEVANRQFNVRYSSATDTYQRYTKDNATQITINNTFKTWHSLVHSSKNIQRKVERDWKMAYLARVEYAEEGEINWKFCFGQNKVKSYTLTFNTKTFNGAVVNYGFRTSTESSNIIGANNFCLYAVLKGSEGDIAWQHAQLFRESLLSKSFSFDLQIQF